MDSYADGVEMMGSYTEEFCSLALEAIGLEADVT